MKLYSKTQLLCAAIGAAVFAAALAVFIDRNFSSFASLAVSRTQEENLSSEKIDFNNRTEEETPSIFEDTGVLPVRPIADASRFTESEQQNIGVYDKCAESVVNISTKIAGINWFLEPTVEDGGTGSGSIIDKRGYIVTNVHVIQNASEIYVSLSDGTQYEAEIVGQDSESDLAVIKFTPPAGTVLKTISFGDSSKLKVGQKVIAIGNPFGLDRTMTTGIVSGLARPVRNSNNRIIRNMIQTDAAINPGNSGGALVDSEGRLVGINSMITSESGSSSGVGFAIPVDYAMNIARQIMNGETPTHAQLGVSMSAIDGSMAGRYGIKEDSGVYVASVYEGTSAAEAGIKEGDVITSFEGKPVSSPEELMIAVRSMYPGDTAEVGLNRDGKDMTVSVTLGSDEMDLSAGESSRGQNGRGNQNGHGGNGYGPNDGYGQNGRRDQGGLLDQLLR